MSPERYPEELTAHSLAVAQRLLTDHPEATMIGGWATWKRLGSMRSHDVDLIVPASTRDTIAQTSPMTESRHIGGRKWHTDIDGIHVDLYIPYQSQLGQRLRLRVEALLPFREVVDAWPLLDVPAQISTKLAALVDRPDSHPGQKDRDELVGLLGLNHDPEAIVAALGSSAATLPDVLRCVRDAWSYIDDMPLTRAERARLRTIGAAVAHELEVRIGLSELDDRDGVRS